MTRIRIDTEHAREVGRRLMSEADYVAQIGRELQNAIGSLDTGAWDGRSRARAAPLLNRVRPENARLADELDELGRKLVRAAEMFEAEDGAAARNFGDLGWVEFDVSSKIPSEFIDSNDARIESFQDIQFQVDLFLSAGATTFDEFVKFMNSIGIVDEYVIEVFYYQDDAIEILSISEEWSQWIVQIPQTSSLWDDFIGNLGLSSTANMGLGSTILKRLPLISLLADLGLKTWDYSDEGLFSNPEYYAAMATSVGLFVVGAGATALAAAGLATIGLPAGVAAVAAGVGWAFVSNWLEEPMIEKLTPAFEWAGEQLDTAWDGTREAASDAAEWAWEGAQDIADDVSEWTSDAVDWTENTIDEAADWVSDQAGNLVDNLIPDWSW